MDVTVQCGRSGGAEDAQCAEGKKPILSDDQRAALAEAVEAGPRPYLDGVVRWRLGDLALWLYEEFGISISPDTVGRDLRAMGCAKLTARPQHHAQDEDAITKFKKRTSATSSLASASSRAGRP